MTDMELSENQDYNFCNLIRKEEGKILNLSTSIFQKEDFSYFQVKLKVDNDFGMAFLYSYLFRMCHDQNISKLLRRVKSSFAAALWY